MNRETKFRAWDKKHSNWAKIQEWSESGVNATIFDGRSIPNLVLHSDNFYEWSQFTGLTDKNGMEIYEGDILGVGYEGDGEITKWEVIFGDDNYAAFELKGWNEETNGLSYWLNQGFVEVVGNIYENPELRKQ